MAASSCKSRRAPDDDGTGSRIVRPSAPTAPDNPRRQQQLQKLRARLEQERAALARWQKRLRRAFNAVEKVQRSIARHRTPHRPQEE